MNLGDGRGLYTREPCPCEAVERERAAQRRRLETTQTLIRNTSAMKPELLGRRLEQYTERDSSTREAKETSMEFVEAFPDCGWLVFSGRVGCGKTHLAAGIANVLMDKLYWVRFVSLPVLFATVKASWSVDGPSDPIPTLLQSDLIVLDELGMDDMSDIDRRELYRLVNERYLQNRPVVVTTSKRTPDVLQERIGDATTDRILERATWCDIAVGSYRREQFERRQKG